VWGLETSSCTHRPRQSFPAPASHLRLQQRPLQWLHQASSPPSVETSSWHHQAAVKPRAQLSLRIYIY
jgi:hypothetical protein